MKKICKKLTVFFLTLMVFSLSLLVVCGVTPRLATSHTSNYSYNYDGMKRVSAKFTSYSVDGGQHPHRGVWTDIVTWTGGAFSNYSFDVQLNKIYGTGTTSVYGVVRESGRIVTHYYGQS